MARALTNDLTSHLRLAYRRGPVVVRPEFDPVSVEDAYVVQERVVSDLTDDDPQVGWKISCTGEKDRNLIGAKEPLSGVLRRSSLLGSGASLPLAGANEPLVEPELILRFVRAPGDDLSEDELAASVEVTAGLEVPHSRFFDWWPAGQLPNLTLGTLIADNAVAGYVVVGEQWHSLTAEEFAAVEVDLAVPGGGRHHGTASAVYGSPLRALAWLVRSVRARGGVVEPGTVVSSGTFTPPVRAVAGRFRASFSTVGDVEVDFRAA